MKISLCSPNGRQIFKFKLIFKEGIGN